jgi:O-antigen/teichoic acid export membrane protein
MQRNEFPAITIALSRILGAVAVVLTVRQTTSLVWLSLCVGGFNLLASFIQYAIARKLLPNLRFSIAAINRSTISELVRYCATLSVWSFSMLLVSGLDVTIVGLFNFSSVGAYSIATTLILFFTGLISAAYSAMLAPLAVLQARNEHSRISRLVLTTTRLNSYFSIGVIVLAFLFGETLVRTWIGSGYLAVTLPVLKILLVAQAIRLAGSAYGTALVGLGLQRYGILPAIIEGVSNLVLSILGMMWIGPTGVAWATLMAAAFAVSIIIFSILPRIVEIQLNRRKFFVHGILIPLISALPLCAWLLGRSWLETSRQMFPLGRTLALVSVLSATTLLIWVGVRRTFQDA